MIIASILFINWALTLCWALDWAPYLGYILYSSQHPSGLCTLASAFTDVKLKLRDVEELFQGQVKPNQWKNWDSNPDCLILGPTDSSTVLCYLWSLESQWWESNHLHLDILYYMDKYGLKYCKQLFFFFTVLEQTYFLGILENRL